LFRRSGDSCFHALTDVSFKVLEGESVALIGSNGAGKSTTLNLITGLARPDAGSVRTSGRIAALLELGSGFHPDLTGAENVRLNAALLGMSARRTREQMAAIIDFAEVGDYIREPLRTYSSGMMVRLAFAIAVHVDPAILIIDEVLGVGDAHFQQKSLNRIRDLRSEGKTMLSVSHSPATVRAFCDRAIWLHHGEVMMDGRVEEVLEAYERFVSSTAAAVSA
jgi:ABC-type polysaccharide/polyol phosphate transport system ATPase subunit